MTDHLTPERRSWNMGRIRSKDTKPEKAVRSLLHNMGYRFTVNGPSNRKLPGKPDIFLPRYSTAIFVHGCYWHRHQGCKLAYTPKTRVDFWTEKFEKNVLRDHRNQALLRDLGLNVLVVWECEILEDHQKLSQKLKSLLDSNIN